MKFAIVEFDSDRSVAVINYKDFKSKDDMNRGAKAIVYWEKSKKECLCQVLALCDDKKEADAAMANFEKTRQAFLQQMKVTSRETSPPQASTSMEESEASRLKRKIRSLEEDLGE